MAATATDEEVLQLIEAHQLMARGISYVDVHLLASVAREMGLAHA